jgi:hypothetical protein
MPVFCLLLDANTRRKRSERRDDGDVRDENAWHIQQHDQRDDEHVGDDDETNPTIRQVPLVVTPSGAPSASAPELSTTTTTTNALQVSLTERGVGITKVTHNEDDNGN